MAENNTGLTVRPVSPEEMAAFLQLVSDAFVETEQRARAEFPPGGLARGGFLGEKLVSGLVIYPYSCWMGDDRVPGAGLSAVVTAAEHRRRGFARTVIRQSLYEMRQRGWWTCALYPASFPFYTRLGWGVGGTFLRFRLQPAALAHHRGAPGEMVRLTGADWGTPARVYEAFARRHNCCLVRDENLWKRYLERGGPGEYGLADKRFAYAWVGRDGHPRGYLIYRYQEKEPGKPWQRRLLVRELVALHREAWRGILAFLAGHDLQADEIGLGQPPDTLLPHFLPDPRVEVRVEPLFAFRLVEVKGALEARTYPSGLRGEFSLAVEDPLCSWNTGTFWVRVEEGRAHVHPAPQGEGAHAQPAQQVEGARPHLACRIDVLSALYSGYLDPRAAREAGRLSADDQALDLVTGMFSGRVPYLYDWF